MTKRSLPPEDPAGPTKGRATSRRTPKLALLLRWIVVLIAIGGITLSYCRIARQYAPYEGWDEIATYNSAGAMWDAARSRVYAYGFLDTAKMRLGRELHEGSVALGKCGGESTYSNNVPASLSDPNFDVRQKNWAAMTAIDFNYFRGIPERQGIFYARIINILTLCLICLGILVTLERALQGRGVLFGLLVLLWLLTTHEFVTQASHALPNAANALLALWIALLCGCAVLTLQWRWLTLATALWAVGLNHKIDFLMLAAPVAGAALVLIVIQRPRVGPLLRALGLLVLVAIVTVCLTNLYLLTAPRAEILRQIKEVSGLSSSSVDLALNWTKFREFISHLFANSGPGQKAAPSTLALTALWIALSSGLFLWAKRDTRMARMCSFLLLLSAVALLTLTPIYRSVTLYHRYFLNGVAAFLAVPILGMALGSGNRGRIASGIIGLLTVGLTAVVTKRAVELNSSAQVAVSNLHAQSGLDLRLPRNRAVQFLLDRTASLQLSKTILVDQHGYFDLLAFRQAGFQPKFINAYTISAAVKALPPGKYGVIAVVGDYEIEPRWQGLWDQSQRSVYDSYQKALSDLPELYRTGSRPMKLLAWQPPITDDIVTVSVLTVQATDSSAR